MHYLYENGDIDKVLAGEMSLDSGIMNFMVELVFQAVQEGDGGYCAECLTENVFTQGDTWAELRPNVVDATSH